MQAISRSFAENILYIDEEEKSQIERAIKLAKEEGLFSMPTHYDERKIPYTIGFYNESGEKRTLVECLLMLAIVTITGEIEEYMLPQWQRDALMKERSKKAERLKRAETKRQRMNSALKIAKSKGITSLKQLNRLLKSDNLDSKEREELLVLRRTLNKAMNGEYCRHEEMKIKDLQSDIYVSIDNKIYKTKGRTRSKSSRENAYKQATYDSAEEKRK